MVVCEPCEEGTCPLEVARGAVVVVAEDDGAVLALARRLEVPAEHGARKARLEELCTALPIIVALPR